MCPLSAQVLRENGSSEILNKLYDTAMDKLEGVKKDYDALRKRYNEKTANHNTDLSRLEKAEEENRRLQKQIEILMKQRDSAIHFQQQYSSSLRRQAWASHVHDQLPLPSIPLQLHPGGYEGVPRPAERDYLSPCPGSAQGLLPVVREMLPGGFCFVRWILGLDWSSGGTPSPSSAEFTVWHPTARHFIEQSKSKTSSNYSYITIVSCSFCTGCF